MSEAEVTEPGDEDLEADLLAKFSGWDKALDAHWSKWRNDARECYRFVSGEQWSEEDKAAMEDQGRIAPVFNRVGPMIDAVSGAEITNRQQVQYFPREAGDSGVNEVLTKGAEYFRDECDAGVEERDSFFDALVCGIGATETRMDYEEDQDGAICVDRIDPLEICADPTSRKRNLIDARYLRRKRPYSKAEFNQLWPGKMPDAEADITAVHHTDPRDAYDDGDDEIAREDEVFVREYQWFETITVYVVENPQNPEQTVEVDAERHDQAQAEAESRGVTLRSVKQRRRKYWRAVVAAGAVLEHEELPDGEFTYKFITGKRDRNKGVWYGLVKPMQDPQRWANQFFSQLLAILASSAKGGLIAETTAVKDVTTFEKDWANPSKVTWVNPGGINSVQPKPASQVPAAIPQLMDFAIASIRDTTGVNQEMLGMVDRDQAGVLEHQRKQAAYGILSAFFDSLRRYRKHQGRLLLKYIQRYVPPGTLVRIVGDDGIAKYVPLAMQSQTTKFDVVVDEAPAGPNQKERVWAMAMQMAPMLKDLDPDIWAKLVKYSPLPTALADDISRSLKEKAEAPPDPMRAQAAQIEMAGAQAKVAKDQSSADLNAANAKKALAEAIQKMGENWMLMNMPGNPANTGGMI